MSPIVRILAFFFLFSISSASQYLPMIGGANITMYIWIPVGYSDNDTGIVEHTAREFADRMEKDVKLCVIINAGWIYEISYKKYQHLENESAILDEKWKKVNRKLDGSDNRTGFTLDSDCHDVRGSYWIWMTVELVGNNSATWVTRAIQRARDVMGLFMDIAVVCTRFGRWSQPRQNGPIDLCECIVADKSTIDQPFRTATINAWKDKEFGSLLANALTSTLNFVIYLKSGNVTTSAASTTTETTPASAEATTTFNTTMAPTDTAPTETAPTDTIASTTTAPTSTPPTTTVLTSTTAIPKTSLSTIPSTKSKRTQVPKSMRTSIGVALIILGLLIIASISLFLFYYWKRLYPETKKKTTDTSVPSLSDPKTVLPTYMSVRPSLKKRKAIEKDQDQGFEV